MGGGAKLNHMITKAKARKAPPPAPPVSDVHKDVIKRLGTPPPTPLNVEQLKYDMNELRKGGKPDFHSFGTYGSPINLGPTYAEIPGVK